MTVAIPLLCRSRASRRPLHYRHTTVTLPLHNCCNTVTLQVSGLEKTLAFMLHRAGITYADAYFDVSGKGGKVPSEQDWGHTRARRAALLDADARRRLRR